jgi:hypothetical protein
MKAQWTSRDYAGMTAKPLSFAPEDVDLIYRGMAIRNAHVTRPTALMGTTAAVMGADLK